MCPIGFGFDQYHEMLTDRQIFRMANFIGLSIAHLDDERGKGSCPQQLGELFFHFVTPDSRELIPNCISYRHQFQVLRLEAVIWT